MDYTPYYSGEELDKLTSDPKKLVVLETKAGTIKLQLFDKLAPLHTANFETHVKNGLYDGTTFHRAIEGFMIQGGDPNSKNDDLSTHGYGDPKLPKVKAEFSRLKHKRGILSAARSNDPNSASSQFFIMVADSPHLDNQYSIFGQVVEGMDAADKIVNMPKVRGDNPGKAAEVTRATIETA